MAEADECIGEDSISIAEKDGEIPFSMPFISKESSRTYKLYGLNPSCPNYFAGAVYGDQKWVFAQFVEVSEAEEDPKLANICMIGGFLIIQNRLHIVLHEVDDHDNKGNLSNQMLRSENNFNEFSQNGRWRYWTRLSSRLCNLRMFWQTMESKCLAVGLKSTWMLLYVSTK
jgi:hypothetical protein